MTSFRIVLFFSIISCCGLAIIPSLSVDLLPDPLPKVFTITYSMSNSSPDNVELLATAPLENAIARVGGIKSIKSISRKDNGSIEIGFDKHTDMAMKRFEIATILRNLYPKLSSGISYPILENRSMQSDSKKPILIYSINGPFTPYQIKQTTSDFFSKIIAQTIGVREVDIAGANDLQLTVEYTDNPFTAGPAGRDKIEQAIIDNSTLNYAGNISTNAGQIFHIKTGSAIVDLSQLENMPIIDSVQSSLLKDNARVYWEEQKAQRYFRINGLNSVTLSIYVDDKLNRIALARDLKSKVYLMEQLLPTGYSLFLEHDDTENLREEINKNYFRLTLTLLVLIIFLAITYRNLVQLVILISSLIATLLITLLFCWLFGITIHLYTIAGLSVSFGMIVDNAILMLDHLQRKNSRIPYQAIAGATLTTITALLLVFFLPDEERLNLADFCAIVSLALLSSVPVSVFFVPAVYILWTKKHQQKSKGIKKLRLSRRIFKGYERFILFGAKHKGKLVIISILAFGTPIFMLPTRWTDHEWYNKTVGNEYYQDNIRPYVDKITGGALRIFVRHVYERSGYREPEKTKLYVYASLPPGHSLEDMNEVMRGMEGYIANTIGIEKYITRISSPEDASIIVHFEDEHQNGSLPFRLKNQLIAKSLDWGGVEWSIFGVGQGFSNSSSENLPSFQVKMKGYNYDELEKQANLLRSKLLKHKRIQKVNTNDRFDWDDRKLLQPSLSLQGATLALQGFVTNDVVNQLRYNSTQGDVSMYLPVNNKWTPVVIKEMNGKGINLYQATKQPLYYGDRSFDLSNASQLTAETIVPAIRRENRQYVRMVGFEYYGSYHFGQEFLSEALKEMENEMPVGYTVEHSTYRWNWDKSKRQYGLLVLLFLGIYVVCLILFENLRQPLVVLVVIPISFIGLFLTFGWLEFYFDQGGYAAFILLGGLTVNASIFIISEFRSRPKKGVAKAAFKKSTPIILTVLSTCIGLVPFLIGGQNEVFWFALAAGTMGGMLFSLIGVFVITPCLLSRVDKP